jgi:hypothetical protein
MKKETKERIKYFTIVIVFILVIASGIAYTIILTNQNIILTNQNKILTNQNKTNNNENMTFKIGDFNMTRAAYLDIGENMIISANSLIFTDSEYTLIFDTSLGTLDFNKTKAIIFEINGTKYKFVKENDK